MKAETVFRRADRLCAAAGGERGYVDEVCRKLGVSEATFYRWRKHFAGIGGAA
jgi:transposase-like protein